MRHLLTTSLVVLLASSVAEAAPLRITPSMRVAPGRLIVKPADTKAVNATTATQLQFVKTLATATGVDVVLVRPLALGWLYLDVADMTDEAATIDFVKRVTALPGVDGAVVDGIKRSARLPNDPLIGFMWHLDEMRLPEAWDITTGSASTRVGVVDSGVISHEDLNDNIGGMLDFISDASVANDGDGRDNDATDTVTGDTGFHGTHVAGTMVGRGNNGVGIAGGSWAAKIIVVRALGVGSSGLTSDINEGAFWLAGGEVPGITTLTSSQRARVVNLSLSGATGERCDQFSAEIFSSLDRAGAIAVSAAGNEGGGVSSPANCGGVIAVGATGPNRERAGYSNFGPEIDIVAPGGSMDFDVGDGVLSAVGNAASSFESGAPYGFLEGTSMATPNVAGVISLMLERDPGLTRDEVEAILRQTGGTCSGCEGKPFIDAAAAVGFVDGGGVVEAPSCVNTCRFADDNECDDGRAGAISAACEPGTDCNDCDGGGGGGGGAQCTSSNNGCEYANDDECDEGEENFDLCPAGTDGNDCGRCVVVGGGGGDDEEDDEDRCDDDNNGCFYANDGECDDSSGSGSCDDGTDGNDCGLCSGGADATNSNVCGAGSPAPLGLLALGLVWRRRRR